MPFTSLLLAAVTPAPALAPAGPWVVDVEENMCLLERSYPAGDQKVSLIFQPLLDTGGLELYVTTADKSDRQYQGAFTVHAGAAAQVFTGKYYSVWSAKSRMRLTRLMATRDMLDQLKDGDTLDVQAKPVSLAFKIVRPDKARLTLQGCIADLKKSWGIDDELASRVVEPLEGNPARYFNPSSYPPEAYQKGIYGRVIALLNISSEGAVEHCRIVSSAGTALNDGTCKVAMRIKFKPPRDKDGKPLPSTYTLPVRWVLPGAPN